MKNWVEKASHLIEALPYIRHFYGKTFVVKCGGAAMIDSAQMQTIMQNIALLHFCGIRLVIVHGGGPEITAMCERLNIPVNFSNGQRVTDDAAMEVVQMVLIGKTNRAIVTALNQFGVKAVGLSGQDSSIIQVKKLTSENDLGHVGEVTKIDTKLINTLLAENFLPIISPIGIDSQGQAHNINADAVASAVAGALSAEKIIFLSDVNGIYADVNDPSSRLSTVTKATLKNWLQEKRVSGGMIPKLQACLQALDQGVRFAHILDGKMPHSLLLEIFTDQGVGTLLTV